MPQPPLIGLTTYLADARWGEWDLPAAVLPAAYAGCLQAAGGRAVLLPPDAPSAAADVVARLDAIVLTGGEDVDPALYGARPHPRTGPPVRERDRWEQAVLAAGLARDIPVLGVCRGMQLMNVHAGGTLIQHLPDRVGHHGHNPYRGHFCAHTVTTAPGTRIGALLPGTREVATHHHQGGSPWLRVHRGSPCGGRHRRGDREHPAPLRRGRPVASGDGCRHAGGARPGGCRRFRRRHRSGGFGGRTESAHGTKLAGPDFPDTGLLTPSGAPIRITP